jgi:hypothetical protein
VLSSWSCRVRRSFVARSTVPLEGAGARSGSVNGARGVTGASVSSAPSRHLPPLSPAMPVDGAVSGALEPAPGVPGDDVSAPPGATSRLPTASAGDRGRVSNRLRLRDDRSRGECEYDKNSEPLLHYDCLLGACATYAQGGAMVMPPIGLAGARRTLPSAPRADTARSVRTYRSPGERRRRCPDAVAPFGRTASVDP